MRKILIMLTIVVLATTSCTKGKRAYDYLECTNDKSEQLQGAIDTHTKNLKEIENKRKNNYYWNNMIEYQEDISAENTQYEEEIERIETINCELK